MKRITTTIIVTFITIFLASSVSALNLTLEKTGETYASSGTWNYNIDSLQIRTWDNITWFGDEPANTNIKFRARTAVDESSLSSAIWSSDIENSGDSLNVNTNQWIEIEVTLETTDTSVTPILYNFTINYVDMAEPTSSNFSTDYGTTNFSAVDITNVTNLTLATEDSGIQFPESYGVNASGEDYDSNIIIGDCFVAVNSSALDSSFNATAYLTFNNSDGHCGDNIIYESPGFYTVAHAIRAGNKRCTFCDQIERNNSFITRFRVPHFSSYAIGSNTRLDIYDSFEGSNAPVGGDIIFYANYTNKTSGLYIASADCKIWFSDNVTQISMTDNSNNYNYTRNFSSAASYTFYVNCSKLGTGYNTLNVSDDVNVGNNVPEFILLTLGFGMMVVLIGLFILRKKR